MSKTRTWTILAVAFLLAAGGCGSPPLIQVETVIHGDGSCDRTIWQPKDEMLPEGALKPAWNALWKSIDLVALPPELAKLARNGQPNDEHHYFSARGTFRSVLEIPPHFRLVLPQGGGASASELVRSYEPKDYGFVREHRWRETLTNIVTRDGFLKARDEFLDLALPKLIEGVEQVYGKLYDVKALNRYIREDVRRFLEDAALVFYDLTARHRPDEEKYDAFAELARRSGLDLIDAAGKIVTGEESGTRWQSFFRHRIALGMRHRDGSRLTDPEIQAILDQSGNSPFSQAWTAYWKQHEKYVETQLLPRIIQMTGPYNAPIDFLGNKSPQFAFDLHLPGQVVESTGTIQGADHVLWRFTGDRSFPDGYVMQARSIEVDLQGQKRILGRAAITDNEQARSYIEILDSDGRLLEAVGKLHASGDLKPLRDDRPGSSEEKERLKRLRQVLGLAAPVP